VLLDDLEDFGDRFLPVLPASLGSACEVAHRLVQPR
jgi:hypothetical protein